MFVLGAYIWRVIRSRSSCLECNRGAIVAPLWNDFSLLDICTPSTIIYYA